MSKYFVFIDESGDASMKNNDPRHNVFVLGAVLFDERSYLNFDEMLKNLKLKYFNCSDVILHSYEMRKSLGVFEIFKDKKVLMNFYVDIENLLRNSNYVIISSIIDKEKYKSRYKGVDEVYEDCLKFIVERSMSCINASNKRNSLFFCVEKRGKKKDLSLRKSYTEIVRFGTDYKSTSDFLVCNPKLFFRGKNQNINGLQLADLIAYPIARKSIHPELEQKTYNVIQDKIFANKYGKKEGWGLKYFP
ncbi:DUF3800 domain-containing protein [Tenacibaculum ascidiaceicola]|uniref:DUF3800 domain-containing protein n=1 Tax=Tenacibaculum ascidiaceicola TaxID=1699411 RepID=UPI00389625FB